MVDAEVIQKNIIKGEEELRRKIFEIETKILDAISSLHQQDGDYSSELSEFIIEKIVTPEKEEILYKENFEEEPYKVELIPFVKVKEILSKKVGNSFQIKKLIFYYGVISNRYVLIKKGISTFTNDSQKSITLVDKKILDIIHYQKKIFFLKHVKNKDYEGYVLEKLNVRLPPEVEQLLVSNASSNISNNLKLGFFFEGSTLKANYIEGYGKIKHNDVEFNLGNPALLLQHYENKGDVRRFFYDFYTFKKTKKYFDELPPLYKKILEMFERMKDKEGFTYPLLVTIGFTFGSIFTDLFKKKFTFAPGLYLYGLEGTGKSLLLKISKIFLGIKDESVYVNLSQIKDLLHYTVIYLDDIRSSTFDKTKILGNLFKNLLRNIETSWYPPGRESVPLNVRGTVFITTREPFQNFFDDESLEKYFIILNLNLDNKVPTYFVKELIELFQNIKCSLNSNERETPLSYVIFLMYQLTKERLNNYTNIIKIIEELYNKISRLSNKVPEDKNHFITLLTFIYLGIYVFSRISKNNSMLEFFERNIDKIVDYILEEYHSYSKKTLNLFEEFVIKVANLKNLMDIGLIDIIIEESSEESESDKEKIISDLLNGHNLDEIPVLFKIKDAYYIAIQEKFLKNIIKEYGELLNIKKIKDLKNILETAGLKEIVSRSSPKKVIYVSKEGITVKNIRDNKRVKIKLFKVPHYIVNSLKYKIVIESISKTEQKVEFFT